MVAEFAENIQRIVVRLVRSDNLEPGNGRCGMIDHQNGLYDPPQRDPYRDTAEPQPMSKAGMTWRGIPRISVVIPAYNVEKFIRQSVESVLEQDFPSFDCIVVDDGSTDRTADILAEINDMRVKILRVENGGVSRARNIGYQAAKSDYILFLDGDDILHPTALSRLYQAIEDRPDAVLVFGTTIRLLPSGKVEPNQKPVLKHHYSSGHILPEVVGRRNVFSNCGQMLIRRQAIEAAGGFDPSLRLSEDWEFFCRLSARGECVYIGPQEEILRHRLRRDSTAPGLSANWKNHLPALEKVRTNNELSHVVGLQRWISLIREVEAVHMFEAGRQNFTRKDYMSAFRLMVRSLARRPSKRRTAIFAAAVGSRLSGRALTPRLRAVQDD